MFSAGCPENSLSVGKFSLSSVVMDKLFLISKGKGYIGKRYSNKHKKYSFTVTQIYIIIA